MDTDMKDKTTSKDCEASEETAKENQVEDGELNEDGQNSNKGDEEDVPDDFFDDFSNQDFMDGLDIVDAWDETVKNKKHQEKKSHDEKPKDKKGIKEPKARSTDRDKHKKSSERRKRSRDRRYSPYRRRPFADREIRRDPSKTKRDIEKDRENYAKKKEQKLISQVIETGLVPPGMETEVNFSELEDKSIDIKGEDKLKSKRGNSKLDDYKSNHQLQRREYSRERKRKRSRSLIRGSPIYQGRVILRNKERRDRSRERSRRSRGRSINQIRVLSPFSPSPIRRRRSRSMSDRERWLKLRRSPSPEKKYKERLGDDKMPFLEEIKMKLDGLPNNHSNKEYNYPSNSNFRQHGPTNNFPLQQMPIPATNPYFHPDPNSQYDQTFFIGDSQHLTPVNQTSMNVPQQVFCPGPVLPPAHQLPMSSSMLGDFSSGIPHNQQTLAPVPPPSNALVSPISNIGVNNVVKLMEQIKANTSMLKKKESLNQLLEENKLSLTDYLSINSRPSAFSSNPEALQKKVNVLSRCQDILKELTGDKKFGGKLIVMNTNKKQTEPQVKNVSPLLRKEPVRFSYSTPSKSAESSSFQNILNKALVRAGVISEVIELDDEDDDDNSSLYQHTVIKQKNSSFGSTVKESGTKNVLMKMCQTEPIRCEDCEKRNAVQYKSIGIQCGESDRYNVGVQVHEMDLVNLKISKNQSLAYLTPAQLLGRGEVTSTKVDAFGNPCGKSSNSFRDYGDWPRSYCESDEREMDYANPTYSGSAMREPQRFPRY